jgi:hypothetical protein
MCGLSMKEVPSGLGWRFSRSCWSVRSAAAAVSRKGRRFRDLGSVPIGLKPVFLVTEVPKCECGRYGQRFEIASPLPRRMPVTRIGWNGSSAT